MIQFNFKPSDLFHPFENLKNKVQEDGVIQKNSESMIECNEDFLAQTISLKAPIVKVDNLLCARNKLAIFTDLLILSGGYISKPTNWHIEAKEVVIQNADNSSWISSLIQDINGKKSISDATFDATIDPECIQESPLPPAAIDTFKQVKEQIKGFRDLISKLKPPPPA